MGAIAQFNWTNWSAMFPRLAGNGQPFVQIWWNVAGTPAYHANDGTGPVPDLPTQQLCVDLAAAHLVAINGSVDGASPNDIVGRISSAGTGSVNVSTQNDYSPGSAQWWQQTKWGSQYWEATAAYRTFLFVPKRRGSPYGTMPWPF